MNIPVINSLNILPVFQSQNNRKTVNNNTSFGLKLRAPLKQDCVSFTSNPITTKVGKHTGGISKKVAKDVHDYFKPLMPQIDAIFTLLLAKLIIDENNPNNSIEYTKSRVKSDESIAEKSRTREWNDKESVMKNMTDILGGKIVLNNASKQSVDKVVSLICSAIDKGQIKLQEVEVKVPGFLKGQNMDEVEKYSYSSLNTTEKLFKRIKDSDKKPKELKGLFQYPDTNYTAIHLLFKVPVKIDGKVQWKTVECQIMGHDVSVYKKLDDLVFKILNGKNIDKKYNEIKTILSPLVMPEKLIKMSDKDIIKLDYNQLSELGCNKELCACEPEEIVRRAKLRREFDLYRAKVFLSQREKDHLPTEQRTNSDLEFFEPLSSKFLSRIFDMNNLYRIKENADKEELKAKKATKGTNNKIKKLNVVK